MAESTISKVFTAEWQKDVISRAKLAYLPFILAVEEKYDSVLPSLWERFQLGIRGLEEPDINGERNSRFAFPQNCGIEYDFPVHPIVDRTNLAEKGRFGAWRKLFYRWVYGKVEGVKSFAPELDIYDRKNTKIDSSDNDKCADAYIKLQDLKSWFADVLCIPLPEFLMDMRSLEMHLSSKEASHNGLKLEAASKHLRQSQSKPSEEVIPFKGPLIANEKPLIGYAAMARHLGKKTETLKRWGLVRAGYARRDLIGKPPKTFVVSYASLLDEFLRKGLNRKKRRT